jgi:hypothetical protein
MGRPIKKKYFGNTNSPYQNQASGGVTGTGGESVASVTLNALGAYTVRPTFTFTAPTLPGGVTATGTITSEVESVTAVSGTQTNYTVGQLVTVNGTDAVLRVATIGGTGGDDALTFDFTGGSRGTFTTLTTGARATTSDGAGAGLSVTLRYRAKAVVIVEAGSKYTAAPTATPTQSVTFASVALTSTKANAIQFVAKTTSAGTVLSGDIFKQEASRRYLVKTTDGVAQCKLVASDTPAFKEMAIVATDTNGSTYWVLKLTAHKALLSRRTMTGAYLFATNTQSGWTLDAATTGKVSINNA